MNEPTLSFNRSTGYYEGTILVQVNAEIFRRMLLLAVEEDETADLTNPQTWVEVIARVGKVTSWIGRPHVKVTSLASSHKTEAPRIVKPKASPTPKRETQLDRLERRLRETAQGIAPYVWDEQCRTPIGAMSLSHKERAYIGRLRSDERKVLEKLRQEWKQGTFILTPDADEQERQYHQISSTALNTTLEAVSEAVNGTRFH